MAFLQRRVIAVLAIIGLSAGAVLAQVADDDKTGYLAVKVIDRHTNRVIVDNSNILVLPKQYTKTKAEVEFKYRTEYPPDLYEVIIKDVVLHRDEAKNAPSAAPESRELWTPQGLKKKQELQRQAPRQGPSLPPDILPQLHIPGSSPSSAPGGFGPSSIPSGSFQQPNSFSNSVAQQPYSSSPSEGGPTKRFGYDENAQKGVLMILGISSATLQKSETPVRLIAKIRKGA